jgi:hypothetical protein
VNAFRARTASPHAGQNLFVQGPFGGFLSTQGNSPLTLKNAQGALVTQNSYAAADGATAFAAGNLAVLRVGDGSESLSSRGNSVFIDQFQTNGVLAGSVALPDNATNALVISGSASSEGALSSSPDGRLLVLAGYQIALTNSASSLGNAAADVVPRALGILDAAGSFAIAALTTNQYGGNNLRAGATDGRGNYWGAGANSGTFYFGAGPTNTVQSTVANSTTIQVWGGDLYFSTTKSTPGIWKISGTPHSPTSAAVFISCGAKASPYAFAFTPDGTTAYIADDSLNGTGGVQRWDYTGGAWALSYAFASLTNFGARGLTADFRGAQPVLYATTAESANNRLVSITDNGPASPAVTLATASANQLFRGVALAPGAGAAPAIFDCSTTTNGVALGWTTLLNRTYTVEFTGDLAHPDWQTLTNLTAREPVMQLIDVDPPATTNRFYRVRLNP